MDCRPLAFAGVSLRLRSWSLEEIRVFFSESLPVWQLGHTKYSKGGGEDVPLPFPNWDALVGC